MTKAINSDKTDKCFCGSSWPCEHRGLYPHRRVLTDSELGYCEHGVLKAYCNASHNEDAAMKRDDLPYRCRHCGGVSAHLPGCGSDVILPFFPTFMEALTKVWWR